MARKRQSDRNSGGQPSKKLMSSSQPLSDMPYEDQLATKQGRVKEILIKLGSEMWTPDRKSRNELVN